MRKPVLVLAVLAIAAAGLAQDREGLSGLLAGLPQPKDYVQKRSSSYDRTGGNEDYRRVAPGATLTLLDEAGPGIITHVWVTIASPERFHLKKLVLRMYWDNEPTPSVEAGISKDGVRAAAIGKAMVAIDLIRRPLPGLLKIHRAHVSIWVVLGDSSIR